MSAPIPTSRPEGQIALVVGGGRGLGEAVALSLARRGAVVVVADIAKDNAEQVARSIRRAGGVAEAAQVDITDGDSVAALVDGIVARHGRLDAAANIAGVVGPYTEAAALTREAFEQIQAVNVTGTFLALQHEARAMLPSGGAIVNTSSVNGLIGVPGLLAYTASKHAVIGMTKVAALELAARNIRVNAVAPGPIGTEAALENARRAGQEAELTAGIPLGRFGKPQEIGDAVAFLLSEEAGFITGTTVAVDGGYTAA
ncbi:SDR family NAD(P)-dependent oxidoreductase [Streptomyces sp. NPDC001312]|uniref:SDR family NAD(P)-dependent oxidoreductase n=1 Tax=Streptomyces sp. NPDC001312 TaxID=3364561 RepID=UPI00367B3FED